MPTIDFSVSPIIVTLSGIFSVSQNNIDFSTAPILITLSGAFDYQAGCVGDVHIPLWTVNGTFESVAWYADLFIPAWTVNGTFLESELWIGNVIIPKWEVSGLFNSLSGFSGNITIPLWRVKGYSETTVNFSGDITIPLFMVDGTFHAVPVWSGDVTIPLWRVSGTFVETPLMYNYRGIAMNVFNFAVSEYTDWSFNSFALHNGIYIAANSDGLFKLGGDTDNGQRIISMVRSGTRDTWNNFIRRVRGAWLSYRKSDGELMLWLTDDSGNLLGEFPFETVSGTSGKLHEKLARVGRGLKDRFISFGFKNVSGSDFDVESLRIVGEEIRERIR